MSDNSNAEFNGLVSNILDVLVAACPLPVDITVETFGLPKGAYDKSEPSVYAGYGSSYNGTPEEALLQSTLMWLTEEGFIRLGAHDHYVATLQTLKLRGAIPKAIGE